MPLDEDRRKALINIAEHAGFSMIVMVDHEQAELDRFGKLRASGGFCYGYAEYWKRELLRKNLELVRQELPGIMPLTDEIIVLQDHGSSWITVKGIKQNSNFIAMVNFIVVNYLLPNNIPQRMLEIILDESSKHPDCHDVRAYWDEARHLHWFDANAGWFRSNMPNPSVANMNQFLGDLFGFLKYSNFKRCKKQKQYQLNLDPATHPKRLTVMFDSAATSLLPSTVVADSDSDDESEADQLQRWVANMRVAY